MRFWLQALLVSCVSWSAFSQTIIGRPLMPLQNPEITPESIPGLYYYWRYTDISTNNAVVTNWIDRIQGNFLTNATAAARPTNTYYGVQFGGAEYLTNNPTFVWQHPDTGSGIGTFWVVYIPMNPATVYNDNTEFGLIAGSSGGQGFGVTSGDFEVTGTSGFHRNRYYGTTGTATNGLIGHYYPAGRVWNLGMSYTQNSTNDVWTNGVHFAAYSIDRGTPSGDQKYVGGLTSQFFRGYVLELGWWTNHLTEPDFQNLNAYATNHYGSFVIQTSGDAFTSMSASGALRNNFTGDVGFAFYPTTTATITHLARWKVAGNTQTHTLRVRDAAGTVLASVSADMSSVSGDGQWHFFALASPLIISGGTQLWILSSETSGGDQWRDNTGPTAVPVFGDDWNRLVGTQVQAGYYDGSSQTTTLYIFGPTNFRFTVP